jgi:hypothetical protein
MTKNPGMLDVWNTRCGTHLNQVATGVHRKLTTKFKQLRIPESEFLEGLKGVTNLERIQHVSKVLDTPDIDACFNAHLAACK